MRVLVTGGCGYVGSVLVPKLLEAGHNVIVIDLEWFGNRLAPHENLLCQRADFKDFRPLNTDAVIHLAGIANDPCGELNPKLAWETNALGTAQLARVCAEARVKQFIYASSGSVYGLSDLERVTEDAPLVPISDYNKTKLVAERCVMSYADKMRVQIVRPATVCGYSPRMRLDVVVNMLTVQALTKGQITVLGGEQTRPNIHIEDMTDLYCWLLERPDLSGIFNAGFENLTVKAIAEMVQELTGSLIEVLPSNDPRSYRMDSSKLLAEGFKPKLGVSHAIFDICQEFDDGKIADTDDCYNLRSMQK
jgi:nucleoside-diphosphate-sugar epimerase